MAMTPLVSGPGSLEASVIAARHGAVLTDVDFFDTR